MVRFVLMRKTEVFLLTGSKVITKYTEKESNKQQHHTCCSL